MPVPAQDGVGSDERSDFGEGAAADGFAADSKTATLLVGQAESLAAELLLEDSILRTEIVDDRILLSGDPAGQGGNEDLPRLKNDGHPVIVANSTTNRQLSHPSEPSYSSQESCGLSKWTLRDRRRR